MTRSNRRPLVAGALAVFAALATGLLSGCGSGQIAQTAQIEAAVTGVDAQASDRAVFIRDALVDYPGPTGYRAGSDAPLTLWIFNTTQKAVRLVGVTAAEQDAGQISPVQVVLASGTGASTAPCIVPASASASPSGSVTRSASARPSRSSSAPASASPSPASSAPASASESTSESASPSASAPGAATIDLTIPAGGCLELSTRAGRYLQAVSLPRPLSNAGTLLVMFQFTTDGQGFTIGSQPSNTGPLALAVGVPASPEPRPSLSNR